MGREKTQSEDRTLWCRYEMKYIIPETHAAAIIQYVKTYLDLDPYSLSQPDGYYNICSLYLDSNHLNLCRETLEGKTNRFKLRIRGYSDDKTKPVFLEIKRRINTVIVKSRARTDHQNIPAILQGIQNLPVPCDTDQDALRQFQLYTNSIKARPIGLVRYERLAFEGTGYNRVRVTFDRNLNFKESIDPEVSLDGNGWNRVPVNGIILEIKFTGRYPAWLGRMSQCFGLGVRGVSKYAYCLQQSTILGFCAPRIIA